MAIIIMAQATSYWQLTVHAPATARARAPGVCTLINPRRACAARVTVVVLCVCLSVCLFVYYYSRTTGYEAIPTDSVLQGQEKQCGDFAETTAFERYGVKTS